MTGLAQSRSDLIDSQRPVQFQHLDVFSLNAVKNGRNRSAPAVRRFELAHKVIQPTKPDIGSAG